ncbi:MAG TPA: amidohydrolase [Syntrophales bacterium]|nr:amidohydrolase [Syntrophales bacterium]
MTGPSEKILDILITDVCVLTMLERPSLIACADIGIRDGLISFIRSKNHPAGADNLEPTREKIDGRKKLLMPGLVNTHTHLPMVLLRGLADDLPLMDWLNGFIFPAEGRFMNKETVYAGSLLAMAEMILSGTTTFCDSYFFVDRIAQAAVDMGMRGIVCQGFLDFPAPDIPNPRQKTEAAHRFLNRWQNRHPLINAALFCHSPYTCSGETLKEIKAVSRQWQVPYLIHLAETRDEIRMIKEKYGKSPGVYLDDLGVLDKNTIALHANWLSDQEINLFSRQKIKVAHCPESNMKLAAGMAPVPELLRNGITVGLGTDGAASNNNLDLFREMGMTARVHKAVQSDPTVTDATTVLRMATIEGARLLGLEQQIGTVEVGKSADLILIDLNQPHLTPLYRVTSHLVYAASGADVSTVIIDGKLVLRERKFMHADLDDIMKTVRDMGKHISRKLGGQ